MARIPVYQETQTPSGSFRVSELRVPDMNLDAMGSALQDMGRSVGRAAEASIKIEEEEAKTWASDTSSNAALQWQIRLNEIKEDPNIATGDTIKTILSEFDSYADKTLTDTTPNTISRKLLQSNFRALRENLWSQALNYQATQGRAERISQMDDSILKTGQVIGLDPNETRSMQLYGERLAEIESLRVTPSERAKLKESLRATVGRSGAEAMARNLPGVLLAQYENTKKMMAEGKKPTTSGNQFLDLLDSTEWDTYINMAQSETDAAEVEISINSVWNRLGPKNLNDPVDLIAMNKAIDEEMAHRSPKDREVAKAMIEEQANDFKATVTSRKNASIASVWDLVLEGNGLTEIMQSEQYKMLNGTEKVKMLGDIASAMKAEDEKGQTPDQLDNYLRLTGDPSKLAAMSQEEIKTMIPQVGITGVKNLLKEHAKLNSPEAIKEAQLDADTFKMVADRAGLKPYETDKSESRLRKLAQFEDAIKARILIEQQIKKRALNYEEKRKIAEQEADNVVMVEDAGMFWFDKQVPVALLTPEQQEDAYVIVNGQEVKISSVPMRDREEIIAARLRQGLPITEQDIVRTYLLAKEKRK